MNQTLQLLSEAIVEALDRGFNDDNITVISPTILEWESDIGKFRYDGEKQTIYIQPKRVVEHLDLKVTIFPTGFSFEE